MKIQDLEVGDVVYAAHNIVDDGSMPDNEQGDVLAVTGSRGVVVMRGHVEEQPEIDVFLVRFEDENLNLGRAIGCYTDDLSLESEMS